MNLLRVYNYHILFFHLSNMNNYISLIKCRVFFNNDDLFKRKLYCLIQYLIIEIQIHFRNTWTDFSSCNFKVKFDFTEVFSEVTFFLNILIFTLKIFRIENHRTIFNRGWFYRENGFYFAINRSRELFKERVASNEALNASRVNKNNVYQAELTQLIHNLS